MARLFDRVVFTQVFKPGTEGLEFRGHRQSFATEMTARPFPNKCEVKIYNLSPDDRDFVEQPGNHVRVFAGYRGRVGLIFSGEVRKGAASTMREGPDLVTTIEARDGAKAFRSARISKSYASQVKTDEVMKELARSFGTAIIVPDNVKSLPLDQGFVARGPARDVMGHLSETLGFDWFFEDGVLVVTNKDADTGDVAPVMSFATGLVEVPVKTDKGVNGKSLLNSEVRPKRFVRFEELEFTEGFYLVTKAKHSGDSGFDNSFFTEFETRSLPEAQRTATTRRIGDPSDEVEALRLAVAKAEFGEEFEGTVEEDYY